MIGKLFSHAETPRGRGAEGVERGGATRMVRMPLRGLGWLGKGWESTGTGREPLRGQERREEGGRGTEWGDGQAPLGFAQSGSSAGRGGVSNDWEQSFQWLEKSGRRALGLEKVFGTFCETNGTTGQQIRGRTWGVSQYDWFRQWGASLKSMKNAVRTGTLGERMR